MRRTVPLALALCLVAACGGRGDGRSEPTEARALHIEVSDAAGIEAGTAVTTRGVQVATVTSVQVAGDHVEITAELGEGHVPTFGAGACVRVEPKALVIEPGET